MKKARKQFRLSRKLLALVVLAAFGSAHAEDDDVARLVNPESSVSAGLGAVTGNSMDRTIFGQYNGLRKNNTNLLLDFNVVRLQKEVGLWTKFDGHNLGLDNRELSFSQDKQGDWKYDVKYSEIVRHDPRTINTGLQNAGTTAPIVLSLTTPGVGTDLNLEIKRKAVSIDGDKWLAPNLMFEASAKNENKTGARLSGEGIACMPPGFSSVPCSSLTAAMLLLPEPINSTTRQFEAKLNYSGDKYMLSGGYYGSFFSNANGSINPTINGNLVNPDGTTLNTAVSPGNTLANYLQQAIALPPDNQAQQLYVSGNYAFTPTTHSTFKYAYTHATQNDDFASMGLTGAPGGVSNLGGVMDTNVAQLGVTARPMSRLSMLGNLHYENKADKTPLALYNGIYTNDLNSSRRLTGKVEGSYQLPVNLRATLGMDYTSMHRDLPASTAAIYNPSATTYPLSGLREDKKELGYRAELRRSMSETLNAAISFVHARRDGGSWLNVGPVNSVGTYPMTMLDRTRNKVRMSADWTPITRLSLQFMFEDGKDTYAGPTDKGLRDSGMNSFGVDAALTLTGKWKLTGYINRADQTNHVDYNVGYLAALEDINTSAGIGVVGKLTGKMEVGGDFSYLNDSNRYQQSMATGAAIVGGGLPDVTYRMTSLKLYGKYVLRESADIRVDLVHQNVKFDEWTWSNNGIPFAYSDNTTVTMQPNQKVTFLGASYVYKFR